MPCHHYGIYPIHRSVQSLRCLPMHHFEKLGLNRGTESLLSKCDSVASRRLFMTASSDSAARPLHTTLTRRTKTYYPILATTADTMIEISAPYVNSRMETDYKTKNFDHNCSLCHLYTLGFKLHIDNNSDEDFKSFCSICVWE